MYKVRHKLPVRRTSPSRKPTKNWALHKKDLQEDFNNHCAYCGSYDGFRHTYFEVDHFVPKVLFTKKNNIKICQYDNLVYSCKFCNNNKKDNWPTDDEGIHNVNNKGYVDPCDPDYENHLKRTVDGGITWQTPLGKWMVEEAFKFYERDVAIRVLWELNQCRMILDALILQMKKWCCDPSKHKLIRQMAEKVSFVYYLYHKKLIDYYNGL